MLTSQDFRQLALSLPDVIEEPHFDKTSFRVKKKIFATMDETNQRVCLMLSVEDQSVFCLHNKNTIYPVPNKWGQKGATFAELATVHPDILKDALKVAYEGKAGKKNGTKA